LEDLKEGDHFGDIGVNGKLYTKMDITEMRYVDMYWIQLAQGKNPKLDFCEGDKSKKKLLATEWNSGAVNSDIVLNFRHRPMPVKRYFIDCIDPLCSE
jgi:hypothetical protein